MSGGKSKPTPVDKRTAGQRALDEVLGPYLRGQMYQGATPYTGELVADMPFDVREYMERALRVMRGDYDTISTAFREGAEGVPAYQFDQRTTERQFQENFAAPVMAAWRDNVAPVLEQQHAGIPGGFHSSHRAKNVSNAAETFYSQNVQPQMFSAYQADQQRSFESGEAAAARRLPAASALQQMPYADFSQQFSMGQAVQSIDQQRLGAAYEEFLRTSPENSPWLQYQLAYLGTPMVGVGNESKGPSFLHSAGTALVRGAAQGYASTL